MAGGVETQRYLQLGFHERFNDVQKTTSLRTYGFNPSERPPNLEGSVGGSSSIIITGVS